MSKTIVKPGQNKTIGPEHREHTRRGKKSGRFTALLLQWASERRPKALKPRKEMTEDELKTWKIERNKRRRLKQKMVKSAVKASKNLGNKKPTPNTCRRRRLAAKHPERR